MKHGGNNQVATRDASASQKQLVSDAVESNMATKKGRQISAYPKMHPDEDSHDQGETKQYGKRRQHK